MHVLMAAAENDALPGLKVGGIGDVVRHLPPALAELGLTVSAVCPAYGALADFAGVHELAVLEVPFGGRRERVELVEATPREPRDNVRTLLLDHPLFAACGRGAVYCDDGPARPFATDASKFALFSAAIAEGVLRGAFGDVQVLHLHDWHTALVLLLRRFEPRYGPLADLRTVFTIHNLGLQGVRPLAGDPSSLATWFPGLATDPQIIGDPRWAGCVNPMACAIRLADAVGTVSPTYAREILEPGDPDGTGRHGGEGLEHDLAAVAARGDLTGILNGCDYPGPALPEPAWPALLARMRAENLALAGAGPAVASACYVAGERLSALGRKRPSVLLTTVGRITTQKLGLLRAATPRASSALEGVLDTLGPGGLYVILGSGDAELEQFLVRVSARRENLVFIRGYTPDLGEHLYAAGDLFLMPSAYEPCGISQMLAMRAGQPCLVHAVGGLRDTVHDGVNGFAFDGSSVAAQAEALVDRLGEAMVLRARKPKRWAALADAARAARFSWADSALAYRDTLYAGP